MGVTGLWRLIDPAGKPVPVETLENKVLAVDISIWLHQMVKGFQDAKGAPMPNAHVLGLFQRVCKLLYFRIKPIFVFDGGFPDLKKETIAKRQDNKAKMNSESERLKREILLLLGKKTAIGSLLGKQTSPKKPSRTDNSADNDDLFKLPEMSSQEQHSSESESEDDEDDTSTSTIDLHSIDLESENFKSLPLKEKHDVLIELKETRKMNSWGKLHELPKDSDNFSEFQMKRLLKRRKVQECLEDTEKEIGGNTMTLNELELLLNEEGIKTDMSSLPTKRIASDDKTRYLLISNVKQALEDAKKKEIERSKSIASTSKELADDKILTDNKLEQEKLKNNANSDDDLQKAIQMSLECVDDQHQIENEPKPIEKCESPDASFMIDSDYSETSEEEIPTYDFDAAKAYIMQNTDFTSNAIKDIVYRDKNAKKPKTRSKFNDILKELEIDRGQSENKNIRKSPDQNIVPLFLSSSDDDDDCISINKDIKQIDRSENIVCTSSQSSANEITNKVKSFSSIIQISSERSDDDFDVALKPITLENNSKKEFESSFCISLDSSIEEPELQEKSASLIQLETSSESGDSDEDFEEVPETRTTEKLVKTVVELNLEIKNTLENDIFADVFETEYPDSKRVESNIDISSNISSNSRINTITPPVNEACICPMSNKNSESKDTSANELQIVKEKQLDEPKTITEDITEPIPSKAADYLPTNKVTEQSTKNYVDIISSEIEIQQSLNLEKAETPKVGLTNEELNLMAEQIDTEHEGLVQEKSRLERMGRNITEQMTRDAQELLQIFGIPYIVAPCEAEAQCAFLECAKLTDGTITDDSDIWLFGGKTVYKNFFNQKKLVMQFLADRIDKSFNLSREQLILLALLVGSDYTTGVNGVGPVTALEILASFSCSRKDLLLYQAATNAQTKYTALLTGLQEFKKWIRSGRRTDDNSLRKKLKNTSVSDDFPSLRVVQAYMEPKVETSKEKFTWGAPDLTELRDYTRKKFGWSKNKLDEILNPVLKRMQETNRQRTMQDYFSRKIEFQSLEDQMSKRVKAAVEKMGSVDEAEMMKPPTKEIKKSTLRKKSKAKCNENESNEFKVTDLQPSTSNIELENPTCKIAHAPDMTSSFFDITVPKLDRYQEIIPQREKDKMNVLKNKLKAIEAYRKTKLSQKGSKKRRHNAPKPNADLSESSDSS